MPATIEFRCPHCAKFYRVRRDRFELNLRRAGRIDHCDESEIR